MVWKRVQVNQLVKLVVTVALVVYSKKDNLSNTPFHDKFLKAPNVGSPKINHQLTKINQLTHDTKYIVVNHHRHGK